jgi:PTH1 family peptidyl-tRNA hydrolase
MKLVVGLGNPGMKYETTRHNVGFLALDRLVDSFKASGPTKKNKGDVYETTVRGEKVLLLKPETFMNNSGRCVAPFYQFYKCEPSDVIVIYDELDLKPLSFRIKTGGGAGGHNGIKSIDEHLGADHNGYHRIRIGIGHPRSLNLKMEPVDYVLGQFSDEELSGLDPLFDRVGKAVEMIIAGDVKHAMTEFNRTGD